MATLDFLTAGAIGRWCSLAAPGGALEDETEIATAGLKRVDALTTIMLHTLLLVSALALFPNEADQRAKPNLASAMKPDSPCAWLVPALHAPCTVLEDIVTNGWTHKAKNAIDAAESENAMLNEKLAQANASDITFANSLDSNRTSQKMERGAAAGLRAKRRLSTRANAKVIGRAKRGTHHAPPAPPSESPPPPPKRGGDKRRAKNGITQQQQQQQRQQAPPPPAPSPSTPPPQRLYKRWCLYLCRGD